MKNTAITINLISDKSADQQFTQQSKVLADQLSLPVIDTKESNNYQFSLFFENGFLKLKKSNDKSAGAIWVDFTQGKSAYRQKHQGKGKLPISKACGIKHGNRPSIIDATAGLGQDAFVLAGLGCDVICIEQHPVVAALLEDGLARGRESDQWTQEIVSRMTLLKGRAEKLLLTNTAEVIYLDPMFPHQQNKKQAKVKKGMHLFRAFPGTSSDELSLLTVALQCATDRVVVKRPDWALPLAKQQATYQVMSKNHRYDVYKTGLGGKWALTNL
ncbi:MAG: class I SAM-dependent methyltransferase [Gammaproteobacteria bacterium]|nr:class I SAM-dependent methyltransferase [Gammaproteobacteria bacterium]